MFMFRWIIQDQLICGQRPGYAGECHDEVQKRDVDAWIAEAKSYGVQSIICLLADDQLVLYSSLPTDLISYSRKSGSHVAHIPARDRQSPPLSPAHLKGVWNAYQELPKPVLVHCSAGVDRTGRAVEHIRRQLQA